MYQGSPSGGQSPMMFQPPQGASSPRAMYPQGANPAQAMYGKNYDSCPHCKLPLPKDHAHGQSPAQSDLYQQLKGLPGADGAMGPTYGPASPMYGAAPVVMQFYGCNFYAGSAPDKSYNDKKYESMKKAAMETDVFLKNDRPRTQFVNESTTILPFVKDAFKVTTGKEMPDIQLFLLDDEDFKNAYESFGSKFKLGLQGFSINGKDRLVFAKKDYLDRVMLTIGHEIGHVLSMPLQSQLDEEAKAFAFSVAWMRAIVQNNIAGLQMSIEENPAKNGLHDVAYEFVRQRIDKGENALDLFVKFAIGEESVKTLEVICYG